MSNNGNGKEVVENLFFSVTCISVMTCIVRSDYNFAMGLLCYYMIKNAGEKIARVATTVSYLKPQNGVLQIKALTQSLFSWLLLTSWQLYLMCCGSWRWDQFGQASQLRALLAGMHSAIFVESQSSSHLLTLALRASLSECFHSLRRPTPKLKETLAIQPIERDSCLTQFKYNHQ